MLNFLAQPLGAQTEIIDDRGQKIVLAQPATNIIALYAAFNEILADLDLEDCLLARTAADTGPPSLMAKPSIGTHLRPNAERIVALQPDLVIQLQGRNDALDMVQFLEQRGLTVAFFSLESFTELFSVMERLGLLTGKADLASTQIAKIKSELEYFQTHQPEPRPTIFFEVRASTLLGAGQKSMVTEIITLAGGINVVQTNKKLIPLGEEEVLRLNPDIYLMQRGPMNPNPLPLDERPVLRSLSCVPTGQFFMVDQDLFSRPGPRSIVAVRQLHEIITHWSTEK